MGTVRRATPEGGRPPTGRIRPADPPPKPNLPLLLAAGGGSFLLVLVLIIVVASGRGSDKTPEKAPPKPRPAAPPRVTDPEVLKLEAEGSFKCEEGMRLVKPRLKSDTDAPKDGVRKDLERGLRLLNEGLIACERARKRTGKDYPTAEPTRVRDEGLRVFCTDLEKEGHAACESGLKAIRSCEDRMTGRSLTDEEKKQLREDLERGIRLITEGMNLFDRSNQVSGNMFDTSKYGQARKAATYKLGELK